MIRGLGIIFLINYLGNIISEFLPFPFPGPVIGMIILFGLLYSKVLKIDLVEEGANLLIMNLVIFFIPPSVKILSVGELLEGNIIKILLIMIITTTLTMVVTGHTVQYLMKRKRGKDSGITK